jgi:Cysteine-rich CPXCG
VERLDLSCPYCGEEVELAVDDMAGGSQSYVEDCPVCCQPWQVEIIRDRAGDWQAKLRTADE